MIIPGDVSIEERVNEGQCELSHFWPDEGNRARDAHLAMTTGSAMRMWVYFGHNARAVHQSTSRAGRYAPYAEMPDYVICSPIELTAPDGSVMRWNYRTERGSTSDIRRVFIEKDQMVDLDIEQTCIWLSAVSGTPRYEDTKRILMEEAGDVNNQVMLQLMSDRIRSGNTLLPNTQKRLLKVESGVT